MAVDKDNEKIVKITFDNAKFEKNIKSSMKSLDDLDGKLKQVDNKKYNMSGLSKNVHKLSDITLRNMGKNLDLISKRFTTMGIAGQEVIRHLTSDVMQLGSKISQVISANVIGGGMRRAFNLEQADFQLQGLLKNSNKVNAIMGNVSESVDGTAYSLDAAAKAASQFAATGMRAGDEMLGALKGVAGVAAMTGADYENISQIFTKVAGNGRLMGDELLQLSSSGLNAAASIAKFMSKYDKTTNYTEQQVREMVSKGQISFKLFSAAMDDAFGEHAKKANDTFNGAMSNVKAALGRIGADFFQPIIKNKGPFVDLLNNIRVQINNIHEITKPIATFLSGVVIKAIKYTSKLTKQMNVFGSSLGVFSKILDNKKVGPKVVNALTKSFMSLIKTAKTVVNIFKQAWRTIFPKDNLGTVVKLIINFVKFADAMKINGERAKDLNRIFQGVAAAFGIFKNLLKIAVNTVIRLSGGSDGLIARFKSLLLLISSILVKVNDYLSTNKAVYNGISNVADVVKKLVGVLHSITFTGLSKLDTLLGNITIKAKAAKKSLKEASDTKFKPSKEAKDFVDGKTNAKSKDLPKQVSAVNKQTEETQTIWGKIGNAIKNVFSNISNNAPNALKEVGHTLVLIGKRILQFIGEVLHNFAYQLTHASISEIINMIIGFFEGKAMAALAKLLTSVDGFTNKLAKSLSGIKKVSDSFCGVLNSLKKTLESYQKSIKADVIKKIAISVGILALSLLALSFIPVNKIAVSLGGLASICVALVASVVILNRALNGKDGDKKNTVSLLKLSAYVIAFGFMVSSIAIALRILATANIGPMIAAASAMEVLILTMSIVFWRISKIKMDKTSIESLNRFIKMLIPVAFSVAIMALAMSKLAKYDIKSIIASTASMVVLLGSVAGMAVVFSKNDIKGIENVKSYIAFTGAILILAYSLSLLTKYNWDRLLYSIGSIELLMWSIVGVMKVMGAGSASTAWSAGAFTACAAAILLVSFALIPITKIETGQLLKSIIAIDLILISLLVIMRRFMSASDLSIAKGAITLIFMGGILVEVANAIQKLAGFEWTSLTAAAAGISAVVFSLMALSTAISKNKIGNINGIASYATLTASISSLANALKGLAGLKVDQILIGLAAIEMLVWSMFALIAAINKVNPKTGIANAYGYVAFTAAVLSIAHAVKNFATMKPEQILSATGSLVILVTALAFLYGHLMRSAGKMNAGDILRMSSAVIAFDVLSTSVISIGTGISKLKGMDIPGMIVATGMITTLLGAMVVVLAILGELDAGFVTNTSIKSLASSMTILSASIMIIAMAINKLRGMSITELISTTASLVVLLGSMVGAIALLKLITQTFTAVDLVGIGILIAGMNGIAIAFNIVALAAKTMAGIDFTSMLVAIGVMAGFTGVFVALAAIAGHFPVIETGLIVLGTSFLEFGVAMLSIGTGFYMFASGVKVFGEALKYWHMAIRPIMGPLANLFVDAVRAIAKAIAEFLSYIGVFISNVLSSIKDKLPEIVESSASIAVGFLTGLIERLPDIVAAGVLLIASFLQGIAENIDAVISAAITLIFTFIESLALSLADPKNLKRIENIIKGFTKYVCQLIDSGFNAMEEIGGHIIEGLIKGIVKTGPNLLVHVGNVALDLANEFCDFFGIHSPSRKFEGYGQNLMQGLTNGIKKEKSQNKAAKNAGKEVVKSYKDGEKEEAKKANKDQIDQQHALDKELNDDYEKTMQARAKRRADIDKEYAKKRTASIAEIYDKEREAQYEGINAQRQAEESKYDKRYQYKNGKGTAPKPKAENKTQSNGALDYLKRIFGVGDTKDLEKMLGGMDAKDMAKQMKKSTKANKQYDIKGMLNMPKTNTNTKKGSSRSSQGSSIVTTPSKAELQKIGKSIINGVSYGMEGNSDKIKKSASKLAATGRDTAKAVLTDLNKNGSKSIFHEFIDKSTQSDAKKEIADYKKERKDLQKQLKEARKSNDKDSKANAKNIKKELSLNAKNMAKAKKGMVTTLKQAADAYLAFRDKIRESAKSVVNSFEGVSIGAGQSAKQLMANLKSQNKALDNMVNGIRNLKARGISSSLLQFISKQDVAKANEQINSLMTMTESQLKKFNKQWVTNQKKGNTVGDAIAATFVGKSPAVQLDRIVPKKEVWKKVAKESADIYTWTWDRGISRTAKALGFGEQVFKHFVNTNLEETKRWKTGQEALDRVAKAVRKMGEGLYKQANPVEQKEYKDNQKRLNKLEKQSYSERSKWINKRKSLGKKRNETNAKQWDEYTSKANSATKRIKAINAEQEANEKDHNNKLDELLNQRVSTIANSIMEYMSISNLDFENKISNPFEKFEDNDKAFADAQKKYDDLDARAKDAEKKAAEAEADTSTVAARLRAETLRAEADKLRESADKAKEELDGYEKKDAQTLIDNYASHNRALEEFYRNMDKLRSMSLDEEMLKRINDMGYEEGLAYTRSILGGGADAITKLNAEVKKNQKLTKNQVLRDAKLKAQQVKNFGDNYKKMLDAGFNDEAINKLIEGSDMATANEQMAILLQMTPSEIEQLSANIAEGNKKAVKGGFTGFKLADDVLNEVTGGWIKQFDPKLDDFVTKFNSKLEVKTSKDKAERTKAVTKLVSEAVKDTNLDSHGKRLMNKLVKALGKVKVEELDSKARTKFKKNIEKLIGDAYSAIDSGGSKKTTSKFETTGKNIIKSLSKGLKDDDSLNSLTAAIKKVRKAIEEGFTDSVAGGTTTKQVKKINSVNDGFKELIKTSKKAQKQTLSDFGSAFDGILDYSPNLNPTITPVVDMSEIQNGMNSINDMFDDQAISIRNAQVNFDSGQIASAADARRSMADAVYSAVSKVMDGISNTGEVTMNNTFNIDGSQDPSLVAEQVNMELGRILRRQELVWA